MIYKVFYTDKFIREGFGGVAKGPLIFIRPKYRDDKGILEHEKVHVRQWWRGGQWRMTKLEREVEAYKEQLKWYPDDRSYMFAEFISTKYGLNVTQQEALELLRGK